MSPRSGSLHLVSTGNRIAPIPLVLAGLVAILLLGCNGEAESRPATSNGEITALIVAGNANRGRAEVDTARSRLIRRCMQAKGFASVPSSRPNSLPKAALILSTGEFTSVPPESVALRMAKNIGFGDRAPRRLTRASSQAVGHQAGSSRSRRYAVALMGSRGLNGTYLVKGIAEHTYPTEGCVAEADRNLYGSDALAIRAEYLPEDLDLVVRQRVGLNPRYLAASRRWSECMARRVRSASTEPYAFPGELHATPEHEVGIAAQDVRCQYRSGFIETAVRLKHRYALRVAQPYREALTTVLAATHRAISRARAIIASG